MENLEEEEILCLYSLFFISNVSMSWVAIYLLGNQPSCHWRLYSSQEYPANTAVFTTKYTQITR